MYKEKRVPPSPPGSTATGPLIGVGTVLGTEIPKKNTYQYDGRWAPWMIHGLGLTAEEMLVYSVVYAAFWEREAWLLVNYKKLEKLTGVPEVKARKYIKKLVQLGHVLEHNYLGEPCYIPNFEPIPDNKTWIGHRIRVFLQEKRQAVRRL